MAIGCLPTPATICGVWNDAGELAERADAGGVRAERAEAFPAFPEARKGRPVCPAHRTVGLGGCGEEMTVTEGFIPGHVTQKVYKNKTEMRSTEFDFLDQVSKQFSVKSHSVYTGTVDCQFSKN